MSEKSQRFLKPLTGILWTLSICTLAVLFFLLLYTFDNKYTAAGPQAQEGILRLSEESLAEFPVMFLVDGWEYYDGRLLDPQDFTDATSTPTPDEIIFIGQYGGFEMGDTSKLPHGSATYRMNILLPREPAEYMLALPEIFSAYGLYINGWPAALMGEPRPSHYKPETGNLSVKFMAYGKTEIILAVSDFSHIYSGMVYPPAFGKAKAVDALVNVRFLFRSLLTAFALAIGLLAVLIGLLSGRNRLAILFGLLCICFVGYTAYPLWQAFPGNHSFLYAQENTSFYALLTIVLLLQNILHGSTGKWQIFNRIIVAFGIVTCAVCFLSPFFIPLWDLRLFYAYSLLVMSFQWTAAIGISISAIKAVIQQTPHSRIIIFGILVFDTALLTDRILPLHEPMVTGWFPEFGSFVLVLCIGISVGYEMAMKYRDNAVLSERASGMEQLLSMHRANYALLTEKIEETQRARHDLRHHFMMIGGFIQSKEYNNLEEYVKQYGVAMEKDKPLRYSENDVVNVLLHHYIRQAENQEIKLILRLPIGKETGIPDADLCAVLSNLLENAIEACCRRDDGRFITLSIAQENSAIFIHIENSTDGRVLKKGKDFASSKAANRKGYGLKSIMTVAKRHHGEAEFFFDNEKGRFTGTVLLLSGGKG